MVGSVHEIQPIGKKILIAPLISANYFMGSFKVPDSVMIAPQQGRVLQLGSKVRKVHVGKSVLFGHGVETRFHFGDAEYAILDEQDVICELD